MTPLHKAVTRVTGALVLDQGELRHIVATLRPPNVIELRAAGRRRKFLLTLEVVYIMAARACVESERRDRAAKKRTKKKSKIRNHQS